LSHSILINFFFYFIFVPSLTAVGENLDPRFVERKAKTLLSAFSSLFIFLVCVHVSFVWPDDVAALCG
jgi:hypothetical protein